MKSPAALQTAHEVIAALDGPRRQSIVVLPFADLIQGTEYDYFGEGLREELVYRLTHTPSLRVVAWNGDIMMRGQDLGLSPDGQQAGIDTILRGSVRRTSEGIRVTAQLIETRSGDYLWSETYDRLPENIFAIQEQTAQSIVQAIQARQIATGSCNLALLQTGTP